MPSSPYTVPNLLSGLRIALVPVLLALVWYQHQHAFLLVLAVALATDGLDGYLARRLHQQTALGAKLDSWGDLFTYGAMVAGLYLAWPALFWQEVWFLALGVGFYLLPTIASLYKFGELPRYHTWAAKLAALLLAPAYYLLTLMEVSWLFRGVILFHVWVAIEEVLIVILLRRNRHDVPTFIHARKLAHKARAALRDRRHRLRTRRQRRRDGS